MLARAVLDLFTRTSDALKSDRAIGWLSIGGISTVLLAAWSAWFFLSRVAVYESTSEARLEIAQAAHPVQAMIGGTVARSNIELGRSVSTGDLLLELDSTNARLERDQATAERDAVDLRVRAIAPSLATLQHMLEQESEVGRREIELARARVGESRAAANLAASQASRATQMAAQHLISTAELQTAQSTAEQARYAASASAREVERLEWDGRRRQSELQAQIEQRERERNDLEAERITINARIARLERDIEIQTIRAPVSGRLADITVLRPGSFVEQGARVASVVPSGHMRIVAEFPAPSAFGRLRSGQPAQMRMEGFPWTEFGSLPAEVLTVGGESHEGRVRVELGVRPRPHSMLPLEHGMPGTVEVEVERLSPFQLVLRAAGQAR